MRRFAHRTHLVHLAIAALLLSFLAVSCTTTPVIPTELAAAIEEALPDLEGFELVTIDDAAIIEQLEGLALSTSATGPIKLQLPAFNASGVVANQEWLAYHVDVRMLDPGLLQPDNAWVLPPSDNLDKPSMTFRGFPDWTNEEFLDALERAEKGTLDLSFIQPSVLNLIGGRLEGLNFGTGGNPNATVLDHLENVLQPRFGSAEAERLAKLTGANYILYRQQDLQPPLLHGEIEYLVDVIGMEDELATYEVDLALDPTAHVSFRVLRPVMVADDTIYDPTTQTWKVSHWFARVDAAANRQNAFLWLANIAPDILNPPAGWTLKVNNNRIMVKTMIAGYLVLTQTGKELINAAPKPTKGCGGAGTFIDRVRSLSNNYKINNEYWMWWTKAFGGGCAYISTLGRTPRDGAVGWSGYGDGTVDWTSFVFMHESGHILGGTHVTNTGTSPETLANHQCKLLGFIPFGPTGPSLMSYASGTRTYCFAASPSSGSIKRNLTKVAEYLNGALLP
jgi:hypothetical protein